MASLSTRRALSAALAVALAWAASCAKDAGIDDGAGNGSGSGGFSADGGLEEGQAGSSGKGGTGGGSSGSGGAAGDAGGWPGGGFGSPCKTDADCTSKVCSSIGKKDPKSVCTDPCKTGVPCPTGGYCAWTSDDGYRCVPDEGNLCAECVSSADCPHHPNLCLASPNVDRFCARDCSWDGVCPTGFECSAPAGYTDGGTDGGLPVGEAGAPTLAVRVCVPSSGESCPCTPKRDGVKRTCEAPGSSQCGGTETCNGNTGTWGGCTAGTPSPEVCDGADNDCNGIVDDATDDALCAGQLAPHASVTCNAGICEVGTCDAGWSRYPPSAPQSEGCACQLETTEPNDDCASASAAGSVTDGAATPLNITGRLTSDGDVDWYKFDTTDVDETTTNSYHVKIVFTKPVPTNDEFVFDVIRGDTCGTPDVKHSALTSYDWCVDGTGTDATGATIGEQSCGAIAPIHCGPHTKPYLVRVRRTASTGTCSDYTLTITGKGGGACDFSQATGACDAQREQP